MKISEYGTKSELTATDILTIVNTLSQRITASNSKKRVVAGWNDSLTPFIQGWTYDQGGCGGHYSQMNTEAFTVNQIRLMPFDPEFDVTMDRIGMQIVGASAGDLFKCLIYGSDANGNPSTLIHQTANLSTTATGYIFETLSPTLSFLRGQNYWLGSWSNSSVATNRGLSTETVRTLGFETGAEQDRPTVIQRTVTFGSAPSPWVYTASELATGVQQPSVRLRVA